MQIRPKAIIELERKISEVQGKWVPYSGLGEGDDYDAKKERIKMLEEQLRLEIVVWDDFLKKNNITELSRICLKVKDGKIQVLIEQDDGTIILSDGTQKLENSIYIYSNSKWSNILSQLEDLINRVDLKEQELQFFFEAYPELILDEKYDFPIPQATIINDNDIEWRADFVLCPKDQLSFAKILELKLPSENISLKTNSGHSKYSAKLFQAINQLKDYYEAFSSEKTKGKFKEKYKTDIFKPDLQLLFGRRSSISNHRDFLKLQRRNNVEIRDWDSVLEQLKRKYK